MSDYQRITNNYTLNHLSKINSNKNNISSSCVTHLISKSSYYSTTIKINKSLSHKKFLEAGQLKQKKISLLSLKIENIQQLISLPLVCHPFLHFKYSNIIISVISIVHMCSKKMIIVDYTMNSNKLYSKTISTNSLF